MPDSRELPGVVHFTFDSPPGETPPPGWRTDLLPVLKSFGDEAAAEDVVLAAGEMIANAVVTMSVATPSSCSGSSTSSATSSR